jgi:hypothetical protein
MKLAFSWEFRFDFVLEKQWTQNVVGRPCGKASPWWTEDRPHRWLTEALPAVSGVPSLEMGRQ